MFVFKCGHRALKLGLKGILICHDVFQVVDVGETTHIQQLLASKVAELHGINTVQSLQTLENLAPQRSIYINVPIGSMYGICTYIYHKNQPFM